MPKKKNNLSGDTSGKVTGAVNSITGFMADFDGNKVEPKTTVTWSPTAVNLRMPANNSWYVVNKKDDSDEAEVMIYDVIGAWGISASQLVKEIKGIKAKTIHVRLNTPGGDVFDGTAIYNALRDSKARIITHIDGVAAS
jgi:ATP-dependent protease ClpP protease subunit